MIKKLTSIATYTTEMGNMLAITYSQIDDNGDIIKRNEKIQKIVLDDNVNEYIKKLKEYGQIIVDKIEDK